MASFRAFCVSILVAFAHTRLAGASSFLSRAQEANAKDLTPELEKSILEEMEGLLGNSSHEITQARTARIEDMLRATFKALPKNEHGRLGHAAVRYSLHSYFVQRHAWHVRGLSSLGEEHSALTPTGILQDQVEEFVQGAFEQRLGSHGLDLKDIALLAATYENLVHLETAQRVDQTLRVMGMTGKDSMTLAELDDVLDVYMMGYVLTLNYTVLQPHQVKTIKNSIQKVYPTWPDTQKFLREIRGESSLHRSYFNRYDLETILEQVHDQYGRWQDSECRDLKMQLLALEDTSIGVNGSGRVRLSTFYSSALNEGNWQFSESTQYLAQNGALDTHGAQRIIIPNYINSPSNCLASSKFYSVCCINECEDLMDHIEHRFAAPSATPTEIVEFVSKLPSSSVSSGRTLHKVLIQRLDEIAAHHDGLVPLHGRLFAQWLHHAYPRECPYPHLSGTTRPQTTSDYFAQSKERPVFTKDEMVTVVEAARQDEAGVEASDECTQWTHHEELYVGDHQTFPGRAKSPSQSGGLQILRTLVYVCAIIATGLTLVRRLPACSGDAKKAYHGKDMFV